MKHSGIPVPAAYLPLHRYLDNRFADAVVLTFTQIEDLLGFTLPDLARQQPEWWANCEEGPPSDQSLAWTPAGRTAQPNLGARTVRFDRVIG